MVFPKRSIAIVHDYLVDRGGAERVVIALSKAFPSAPIYTSVFNKYKTFEYFSSKKLEIISSYVLNCLLTLVKRREWLAPLILFYFKFIYAQRKKLNRYDLIISSSSAFAIDVRHHNHLCYCHTPARFIWHNIDYNPTRDPFKQFCLDILSASFKPFDLSASKKVKRFLTNSKNMQNRIKKCYHREALIVYPTINVHEFKISTKKKTYFLIVSRLKQYKQVDLAIKVFNELGLPLYIAGVGSEEQKLKALTKENISFLGRVPDAILKELYANCRAFIFPGEEDFGITPLEAQASGRPVIAYGKGGILETVLPDKTGIFFNEHTISSLKNAVLKFLAKEKIFDAKHIRKHAEKFDEKIFIEKIRKTAEQMLSMKN
jgi:glycosyltransferase involved in cell wall biosynthesis